MQSKKFTEAKKFGPALDTHRANKASSLFETGRPVAPKIGLRANGAGSKAGSGLAHSHPELLLKIPYILKGILRESSRILNVLQVIVILPRRRRRSTK
jgi:hypothetical protein